MKRVKPPETIPIFIPIRFRVRMKVRAPGVNRMRSATSSRAVSGKSFSSSTRLRSESPKSISPAIARAVRSPASSAPGCGRKQIDDLVLDQSRVDIHHHESFGAAGDTLGLNGDIDVVRRGRLEKGSTHRRVVAAANCELITHHRIAGKPLDGVDVAAGVGDGPGNSAKCLRGDPGPDHRDSKAAPDRDRNVRHRFEIGAESVFPGVMENVAHCRLVVGLGDEHVETQAVSDDDLLDVVELTSAGAEEVHEPRGDTGSVWAEYSDEKG